MGNYGIEQFNYFCPRKRIFCNLSLTVQYDFKKGKIYSAIDCDEKLNCRVGNPDEKSKFNWDICPAYQQYVQ
jgi:hypothetical protein